LPNWLFKFVTPFRRFLSLVAFAFWQGGFTFYAAVVVPTGTEVLGSAAAQGFITRHVTVWLNVSGAVAVPILLWDAAATRPFRRSRIAAALLLAAGLVALAILHPRLDSLLDPINERVRNRHDFTPMHRTYLWISTVQWAVAVVYLILTPLAWRKMDRSPV
jgi:hypothetical protein